MLAVVQALTPSSTPCLKLSAKHGSATQSGLSWWRKQVFMKPIPPGTGHAPLSLRSPIPTVTGARATDKIAGTSRRSSRTIRQKRIELCSHDFTSLAMALNRPTTVARPS